MDHYKILKFFSDTKTNTTQDSVFQYIKTYSIPLFHNFIGVKLFV
ncbi:hypothetical protein J2W95_000087 [Flavobacterium granuli]|uniref:Uncharacterized protein n=1 Tax=Flavobacterium granuli TaxID=280093 RepID=A0ABU1RXB4_9FLAO|nr:hypothetical protein [Flavobacterium granuli]